MSLLFQILFLFVCLAATHELSAKKKVNITEREVPSNGSTIKSLHNSLDPYSVSQHLAFYELYPETAEGKAALKRAWELLNGRSLPENETSTLLPTVDIQAIVSLVTRQSSDSPV